MEITFLGTGTSHGVPMIGCQCPVCKSDSHFDKRLRSSIMLVKDGFRAIIDTGPDFRYQMLREDVRNLDAIIFTHEHRDHTAGLDDTRAFNLNDKHELPVYATVRVQENLKKSFDYIFTDHKYPGIPNLRLVPIADDPFMVGPMEFVPVNVLHYKLPVLGFRTGNFTYITDANFISSDEKDKIRGSEVLVLNALRISTHISHFSLDQALEVIEEINPERAYLTHISHQLGKHEDVSKRLPPNVHLAYDRLKLHFD